MIFLSCWACKGGLSALWSKGSPGFSADSGSADFSWPVGWSSGSFLSTGCPNGAFAASQLATDSWDDPDDPPISRTSREAPSRWWFHTFQILHPNYQIETTFTFFIIRSTQRSIPKVHQIMTIPYQISQIANHHIKSHSKSP